MPCAPCSKSKNQKNSVAVTSQRPQLGFPILFSYYPSDYYYGACVRDNQERECEEEKRVYGSPLQRFGHSPFRSIFHYLGSFPGSLCIWQIERGLSTIIGLSLHCLWLLPLRRDKRGKELLLSLLLLLLLLVVLCCGLLLITNPVAVRSN